MKKLILSSFFILFLSASSFAQFGNGVWDGLPLDSATYTFELYDSLAPHSNKYNDRIDTTGAQLWRIGTTSKPFFSSGTGNSYSIMTDTALPYPVSANDWFVLKLGGYNFNTIVSFWHKYQTDSLRDGCILEYSIDTGNTWENVKGECNVDSGSVWGSGSGVLTENLYKTDDTLITGEQAFSGNSGGWIYSRVQFWIGLPIKTTGTTKNCIGPVVYLRFRFLSDTIADTLDGWMIDSIKVEHDKYFGGITRTNQNNQLSIYPNPSYNGIINFPALRSEQDYTIEIINTVGVKVLSVPYKRWIDLSAKPKGLYYYRVSNGEEQYTGHVLLE